MRRALALLSLATACTQAAPHALVRVTPGSGPAAGAVLVMPTVCVADGVMVELCSPPFWVAASEGKPMVPPAPSFAAYVDPPLRLKLEFAGYTLAEAAAMRLTTGTDASGTVAELTPPDVRAVAQSLALTGIITSTFTITAVSYGEHLGTLTVTLYDVGSDTPRWTVRCAERIYDIVDSPTRLAGCAGNGILAALAPDNLIGKAL